MDTYLPPKYSLNSFFVRHVAHPRRMKYISGLGNAKICSVNDVGYINMPGMPVNYSPSQRLEFPPNNFNEELLKSESLLFKRKEKAIAPNGMWNTFGMIDNTEKWRSQLNSLASSVGLLTQSDLEEMRRKKEREEMIRNYQFRPAPRFPPPGSSNGSSRAQSAITKIKTPAARLNEPLPPQSRHHRTSRQLSRGLSASANHLNTATASNKHYVIDSADRELWMLQVLCQILQTDNLADVQSWLVSTNDSEKERVKQLIDQAMRGLEESGRISEQNANISNQTSPPKHTSTNSSSNNNNNSNPYYTNQLTNEINENRSALAHIENALQKIDLNKVTHQTKTKNHHTNSNKQTNVLKLDDDSNSKLETIDEATVNNNKQHTNSPSDYYNENNDQNLGVNKEEKSVTRIDQNNSTNTNKNKNNEQDETNSDTDTRRKKNLVNRRDSGGLLKSSSAIFNINMHKNTTNNRLLNQLEKAIVKIETPKPGNDFSIEQVTVTMLVKDQHTNKIQEIAGDWTPTSTLNL